MYRGALNLVFALVICLAGTACSGHNSMLSPEQSALFWPASPQVRRIAYVTSFSNAADLGISGSTWDWLLGLTAGRRNDGLARPMAVVATPDARVIYVADAESECIHRFDTLSNRYACLAAPSGQRLMSPVGLAISSAGWLYVSDSQLGMLFKAGPGAKKLEPFEVSTQIQRPTGLFWDDARSYLYVSDTIKQAILVFDVQGDLKRVISGRGSSPGEVNFPTYLWMDSGGELLVSDSLNFRVQRFTSDGKFLHTFGEIGDRAGDFSRPKGVATDSFGNVYVIDALMHALQIFDPSGALLLTIGEQGQGRGEFWLPNGIYITGDNTILVTDTRNRRVQIFRYVGPEL